MTSTTIASGYVSLSSSTYLSDGAASVVYAAAASTPTLTNAGTIVSTGSNYTVSFAGSGTITNTGILAGTGEVFGGSAALFINSGTVLGPSHYAGGNLRFNAGGSVTNTSTGILETNIYAPGGSAPVTVVNNGYIFTNAYPVFLYAGGTLTNTGTIHQGVTTPVKISNAAASVANSGSIDGHLLGIDATNSTAVITNTGTGQISAFWAVAANKPSTITNSATIVGDPGNTAPAGWGGGTIPGVGVYLAGGVVISDAIGTVANQGTIIGTSQYGAFLLAGGSIYNAGTLSGGKSAVYIKGGTGSVYNSGTLTGGTATGVYLQSGGGVVNAYAAAYITGPTNAIAAAAGSYLYLRNDGTITSPGAAAIFTTGPGNIFNRVGARIYGGVNGVNVGPNSTVTNAGSLDAPNHAVELGNGSTLALYPGSALRNSVGGQGVAAVNGNGTIELLAGADPILNHGSLFDIGNHYINFDHIIADPGASWTIGQLFTNPTITAGDGFLTIKRGTAAITLTSIGAGETLTLPGNFGGNFSGVIAGATFGDTLVLPNTTFADGDTATIVNGSTLAIYDTTNTQVFAFTNFTPAHGATSADFIVGPHSVQDIACFASGTRISTPTGQTPIENLKIGDLVLSAFGGSVPIQWIGQRSVDATRHPNPEAVWPIRIAASALADNIPSHDLYLSPEHAIHLDNHLIPAHLLVNSATIAQIPRETITYFHLELPQHDVILAENTPCETYLDTNNRADFENADGPITLHPTFTADELWRAKACAPQCRQGPVLETIRRRLAQRSSEVSDSGAAWSRENALPHRRRPLRA